MSTDKRALIVVDVQRDFVEGGALAVDGGNAVAERIADYLRERKGDYAELIFTRDKHNAWTSNCGHFSEQPDYVDSWPRHCVEGTPGAYFHRALYEFTDSATLVDKGQGVPGYSAFDGSVVQSMDEGVYGAFNGASLAAMLRATDVTHVDVCGLVLEHCVRATSLDVKWLLNVSSTVLLDLTASIDPDNDQRQQLAQVGIQVRG